jgi:hypothetical protein
MTAAEAIATYLSDEWETDVPGRHTPIPDVVADQESGTGVLIRENMSTIRDKLNTHDVVNVQHVDRSIQERGSKSEKVVDQVQIDVRMADRDVDGDGIRESATDRAWGTRDANNDRPELGGVAGEVKRLLNDIRKGFKEYDKAPHGIDRLELRNTDARITFTVELTIIERDVQQPL